jgi:primosomal protein N' (replication factor Y)
LITKGFGTNKYNEELIAFFPDYKIGRMDQDISPAVNLVSKKSLIALKIGKLTFLVGTQMLKLKDLILIM